MTWLIRQSNTIINNVIYTKKPSTSRLVTETQYYLDKQGHEKKIEDIEKKISHVTIQKLQILDQLLLLLSIQKPQKLIGDITNVATKATLNTKATLIENKIPDIAGFITTP